MFHPDKRRLQLWIYLIGMMLISSCAVVQSGSVVKIALLAPFEERYRDIGYNALYSVRLAIADSQQQDVHLLAVDDGGTVESAVDRMQALNLDPSVKAIIVLGQFASHPDVQQVNDKPLIVVGQWGHDNTDSETLMAHHPDISQDGILISALTFTETLDNEILSSATLPDADFAERYINSDLYVPEPNLLASLTYDMSGLILKAIESDERIIDMTYSGINGEIQFADGYWQNAPILHYQYVDGELIKVD